MTTKEFRRARWQLRRDFNLLVRDIFYGIWRKINDHTYRHLRAKAHSGGKAEADAYWEFYKVYWRRWGG